MARFGCRCFVFLLLSLQFFLLKTYANVATEVCVSKGGRFPPYASEGKPPKKVSKGPRDLIVCRVFRKRTCCDVTQTHPVLVSIRRLASSGNASQECSQLWELLECSICDPWVGVQRGPSRICASFCDRVYEACSTAYFSMDQKKQVLVPCNANELLCARASLWVSNGTELCHVAGFSVVPFDDPEDISCYGGKASMDYIKNSWKTSEDESFPPHTSFNSLGDFMQWTFWIALGIVLVAVFAFARRRMSRNRRYRERAVQHVGRKLGRGSSEQVKRM